MKYKVKQYILRAAPLILVCCMFVFSLSPSASADALNYRDYEKYVTVEGDKDLVTLEFPIDEWMDWWFSDSDNVYLIRGYGSSFSIEPENEYKLNDYLVMYAPFGGATFGLGPSSVPGHYLSTSNIPSDAKWTVKLKIFLDDQTTSLSLTGRTNRNWVVSGDSCVFYNEISADSFAEVSGGVYEVEYSGSVVSGYDGWFPQFLLRFKSYPTKITFELNSFQVIMSISSLYRLQEETGETNELLDEVSKQLAEQGKTIDEVLDQQKDTNDKLDNIINGEVDPEAPEGADKIGDLDNAEGQLRDEAQAGLDEGVQIQQNVLQILEQYANGFAVFSWIFGLFAKLPFFSSLLYVSLALGTVAALLNLGLNAQSRARSNARKKGG